MAKALLKEIDGEYLNWDDGRDRRRIRKYQFSTELALIVFAELHKAPYVMTRDQAKSPVKF